MVHAGAPADAAQHLAKFVAKHPRAAVVHQDDMHLLGAVVVVGALRAVVEVGLLHHLAAGGGPHQQAQRRDCMGGRRHQLPDHRSHVVDARRCGGQFGNSFFVGDGAGGACISDQEVWARDADVGVKEVSPQPAPRPLHRPCRNLSRWRVGVAGLEQFRHLFARAVHGGPDDMQRPFARKLDDMLGQVRLHPLDPGIGKRMGHADLLAQHRFGAGDQLGVGFKADAGDDGACFGVGGGSVDACPSGDGVPLELLQVVVQIGDDMVLDRLAPFARGVEFGKGPHGGGALAFGGAGGARSRSSARRRQGRLRHGV